MLILISAPAGAKLLLEQCSCWTWSRQAALSQRQTGRTSDVPDPPTVGGELDVGGAERSFRRALPSCRAIGTTCGISGAHQIKHTAARDPCSSPSSCCNTIPSKAAIQYSPTRRAAVLSGANSDFCSCWSKTPAGAMLLLEQCFWCSRQTATLLNSAKLYKSGEEGVSPDCWLRTTPGVLT